MKTLTKEELEKKNKAIRRSFERAVKNDKYYVRLYSIDKGDLVEFGLYMIAENSRKETISTNI